MFFVVNNQHRSQNVFLKIQAIIATSQYIIYECINCNDCVQANYTNVAVYYIIKLQELMEVRSWLLSLQTNPSLFASIKKNSNFFALLNIQQTILLATQPLRLLIFHFFLLYVCNQITELHKRHVDQKKETVSVLLSLTHKRTNIYDPTFILSGSVQVHLVFFYSKYYYSKHVAQT